MANTRKWRIASDTEDRDRVKKVLDGNNIKIIKECIIDNVIVGQIFIVEVDREQIDEVSLLKWLFIAGAFEIIPGWEEEKQNGLSK